MSWVWLRADVVRALHQEQLAEHGGPAGIRDAGMLDSALHRPVHKAQYGEPDVAELAASYAFGIARNHPFVDGNKRTAFVCLELFLMLNGRALSATDDECVRVTLALAAGEMNEEQLAAWVRASLV